MAQRQDWTAGDGGAPGAAVVAFNGCGLPRLRGLTESLLLTMPGVDASLVEWVEGLTEASGRETPRAMSGALAGRRVVLLCADPREAVLANYRLLRVERRAVACSLDDLLCARAPGDGALTPECRLGLRACVDFMSAFVRSQQSFRSLLIVHADEMASDAWAVAERVVRFAGFDPSEEDLASAGRRAGPLARSGSLARTSGGSIALGLSEGQRVFAAGVIAEHLHPVFDMYRASAKRGGRRLAA